MTPTVAKNDKAALYQDDCWSDRPFTRRQVCTYGKQDSQTRIALVGNSHAGMWHAALADIATKNGWRLDTYLVSECYTVAIPLAFETDALTNNCLAWNEWALESLEQGGYDTVVLSNFTHAKLKDVPETDQYTMQVAGYTSTIDRLLKQGMKVLTIRDAPAGISNIPDCLAKNGNDATKCDGERAKVLKEDPLHEAATAHKSPYVEALDLSDRFCDETKCYATIGKLIVYFDHGHITNTYAKTLTPDIEIVLARLMATQF